MPGGWPHVWAGRCTASSGTSGGADAGSGEVAGMSITWSAVESSACSTGVVWTRLAGGAGAGRLRGGSGRGGGTGAGEGGRSVWSLEVTGRERKSGVEGKSVYGRVDL